MSNLDATTRHILVTVPDVDTDELEDIFIPIDCVRPGSSARIIDVTPLLAEYAEWRDSRADLSDKEDRGEADADDWQASDDAGCDLASRLAAIFEEDAK